MLRLTCSLLLSFGLLTAARRGRAQDLPPAAPAPTQSAPAQPPSATPWVAPQPYVVTWLDPRVVAGQYELASIEVELKRQRAR